jgi:hypothetical protein
MESYVVGPSTIYVDGEINPSIVFNLLFSVATASTMHALSSLHTKHYPLRDGVLNSVPVDVRILRPLSVPGMQ